MSVKLTKIKQHKLNEVAGVSLFNYFHEKKTHEIVKKKLNIPNAIF